MQGQKLTRSQSERMIAGVCGGLAQYFSVDPTLVRLLFVILAVAGGAAIPVYVILWVVLPQEGAPQLTTQSTIQSNLTEMRDQAQSVISKVTGKQQPQQDWEFDPYTGQPLNQNHTINADARFDPYTGQPLNKDQ